MIEKFKSSQDFIDISYMIDHVEDIKFRLSLLEELGYKLGTSIVKTDLGVKHISIVLPARMPPWTTRKRWPLMKSGWSFLRAVVL